MDDRAPLTLTPREGEILEAFRGGARSLSAVARAVDPPISSRTAEAHVASIAEKLPTDFEPEVPGFWRVVILVCLESHRGGPE